MAPASSFDALTNPDGGHAAADPPLLIPVQLELPPMAPWRAATTKGRSIPS